MSCLDFEHDVLLYVAFLDHATTVLQVNDLYVRWWFVSALGPNPSILDLVTMAWGFIMTFDRKIRRLGLCYLATKCQEDED